MRVKFVSIFVCAALLLSFVPAFVAVLENTGGVLAAEPPATEWSRTFDYSGFEVAHAVQQTADGGYVAVGAVEAPPTYEGCVLKTDSAGNEVWFSAFGPSSGIYGQETLDNGFIVVGGVQGPMGEDIFLVKTDSNGNVVWTKTYAGSGDECGIEVDPTFDGGYVLTGRAGPLGTLSADILLMKTDQYGNEVWSRTFSTSQDFGCGVSVEQTTDGGYIVAGGSANLSSGTERSAHLIKTDPDGYLEWDGTRPGAFAERVQQTSDGGYVIVGWTGTDQMEPDADVLLVKIDPNGTLLWERLFGAPGFSDAGKDVMETSDGGYIVAAETQSYGAGFLDAWLIKTDSQGQEAWSKTFGGPDADGFKSVRETVDGGYIAAGFASTSEGVLLDIYLVKLANNAPPSIPTATGTGTATLAPSSGSLDNLTAIPESEMPEEGKPDVDFPHGFFEFEITGLNPGDAVTLTITLPSPVPVTAQYWKYGPTPSDPSPHWYVIPMGDNDGDNVITITLVDGGLGDDDLVANGIIIDQGGPGWPFPPAGGGGGVPVFPSIFVGIGAALGAGLLAYFIRRRLARPA